MLLTKFGKNPTKHVEEEANCEKERKKKKKKFWNRKKEISLPAEIDRRLILDPRTEIESLKLMNMYDILWPCCVTWTNYSIFSEFDILTPVTPNWPQTDIWPHNRDRGSQADEHVWVLWPCCVTWTNYSIFSEFDLLTPVTPNDPRLTLDPIT